MTNTPAPQVSFSATVISHSNRFKTFTLAALVLTGLGWAGTGAASLLGFVVPGSRLMEVLFLSFVVLLASWVLYNAIISIIERARFVDHVLEIERYAIISAMENGDFETPTAPKASEPATSKLGQVLELMRNRGKDNETTTEED